MANPTHFDVIISQPGFNKFAFLARKVAAADLGAVLAAHMGTRAESHYEGGDRECAVDIHVHPTYWLNVAETPMKRSTR